MAIDAWFAHVIYGEECEKELVAQLRTEVPPMLSWISRGGCAVQCEHCIFPVESAKGQVELPSAQALIALLGQLTGPGILVHEGRTLLRPQIPVLAAIRRAGHRIALINNGLYTRLLSLCEQQEFVVDTLDISVDGTPAVHNTQRNHARAWEWAMEGLSNAGRILTPEGTLTSLFTLTRLNCDVVCDAGELLIDRIDEWHFTTMSLRHGIEHLRADKRSLESALHQLLGVRWGKPVKLRTYSLEDFVWLLEILGRETARKALAAAQVVDNAIVLDIGLPLYFYPKSLAPNETIVVDADAWWRFAYCIQYTLEELKAGQDARGRDISHFTIMHMSDVSDLRTQFARATNTWWRAMGQQCLAAEQSALQHFR